MKEYKVDKLKCAGCGACIPICPHQAIKFDNDKKVIIDKEKCRQCGKCMEVCPFNAIKYE
jgi:Fe-S-cluster-containing hydrogenase component 2